MKHIYVTERQTDNVQNTSPNVEVTINEVKQHAKNRDSIAKEPGKVKITVRSCQNRALSSTEHTVRTTDNYPEAPTHR